MSLLGRSSDELSPAERRALLAELLKHRQAGSRRARASFAQKRLWFLEQLSPGSAAYTVPVAMRLPDVDPAVVERALGELVARHETLRTTFTVADGEPVQVIAASGVLSPERINLGRFSAAEREAELQRRFAAEAQRVFDLARGPLVRAALVALGGREQVLLLTLHHIVCDAWSMNVLFGELSALCADFSRGQPSPLPPLPIQYADFAAWQHAALSGPAYERHLAYWRERLAGAAAVLPLPFDRPPAGHAAPPAGNLPFAVAADAYTRLDALARSEGATLFMALLAAFAFLLRRYTGQRDIVVGTPIANRTRSELEGLIGFFTNTLVLRLEVPARASFRDLLRHTRAITLEAYAHQDLPFEKLVEELRPERSLMHNPLFQVMFAVQNQRGARAGEPAWAGPLVTGGAKFPLTLTMVADPERLGGTLEYNAEMFEAATAARFLRHYRALIEEAAAAPDQPAAQLGRRAAGEPETHRPPRTSERAWGPGLVLHGLIERQARRCPDAVAVEDAGSRLTYGELELRAAWLAGRLRGLGVGPDTRVAVCLERSLELAVGLLGVLKAGGAFVPVDLSYGGERVRYMLEHSGAKVVLAQPDRMGKLPPVAAQVVPIGPGKGDPTEAGQEPDGALPDVHPDHLAYVIYTSGSTGQPKGVMITHAAICNHVLWMLEEWPLTPEDVVLQKTPTSFDASVWELFVPLAAGSRLLMAPPGLHRDSRATVRWMRDRGVTVAQFVPSLLQAIADEPVFADGSRLRLLFCGGEVLPAELARRVTARSSARLVNLYGPTEATIDATFWNYDPMDPAATVPIGRPITNLRAYVLDEGLEPVPLGAVGQLYLSGVAVARGYLGRPGDTAEKFRPDPFATAPGRRTYATGDLVRERPDGRLDFVGRADHQVKVRGYRVELAEIDAVLAEHPAVCEAVTLFRQDGPGGGRLVAYVTGPSGQGIEEDALPGLLAHLRARLPEWMVPVAVVPLPRLPTTPGGKIDRRALPPPPRLPARSPVPPRNPIEHTIRAAWAQVLHADENGIDDDFFALGGHSLAATQVAARLRDAFRLELPLRALFEHTTIRSLADHIRTLLPSAPEEDLDTVPSPGQLRAWLAEQIQPGHPAHHVAVRVAVPADADATTLQRRLAALAERHPILCAALPGAGGFPVVRAGAGARPAFSLVDLRSLEGERRAREVARLCEIESALPFPLAAGPLLRATLLRAGGGSDALLLVAHATVADAPSLRYIGAVLVSPEEPAGVEEIEWTRALAGWRRAVAGAPGVTAAWRQRLEGRKAAPLPCDRPRPRVREREVHWAPFSLFPVCAATLVRLAEVAGGGLREAALALTAAFVHTWTGATDVLLAVADDGCTPNGTEPLNRTRPLIGPLAGRVLVSLSVTPDQRGVDLLAQAAAASRAALQDGVALAELHLEAAFRDGPAPPEPSVGVEIAPPPNDRLRPEETEGWDWLVRLDPAQEGREGIVACAADAFETARASDFAAAVARLAEALAAQPEMPIGRLPRPSTLPGGAYPSPGQAGAFVPARTLLERSIAGVWRTVLGVDRVGAEDDFVRLGGNTQTAVRVSAALADTVRVGLPPRRVLEAKSLAALAVDLLDAALAQEDPETVEAYLREVEQLPVEEVRERIQEVESRGQP